MSRDPSTVAEQRGRQRALVAFGILGSLLVAGLAGGGAYLKYRANMAGLEGTWREQNDANHTFQFRANGNVDARYQGWLMGNFMTWRRDGRQITIHSTRGSDFVGQLGDGEIRGQETIRDVNTGEVMRTADQVWRRE
jgi:hypothetical protein